jgi:hypothetical protein
MVRMGAFPGDCLDIRRIKESNRKGLKVSFLRGEKFTELTTPAEAEE